MPKMTTTTEIRIGCATVAQRLRNRLTVITGISGPKTARTGLGMALKQIGEELGNVHPNGHGGKPFSKSTICHWEKGDYEMTPETQVAYRILIDRWVAETTDGRLAVRVKFGRRWTVTPLMVCECGTAFKFRNVTEKYCKRCRRTK